MKTACIVHYNTQELTEATILSLAKQEGGGWRVFLFDNSDRRPWDESSPAANVVELHVIDNTRGDIIDFESELERLAPARDRKIGEAAGCNFGSAKHMMSVEWLLQNMMRPFILMDSDILMTAPVGDLWDETVTAAGKSDVGWYNPAGVKRLMPMLCFINAPECRRLGIHYFDPCRAWALNKGDHPDRNWYDTGASFLEDIISNPEATLHAVDIDQRMLHFRSGSWLNSDKATQWLNSHADLWRPSPQALGKTDVALCAIGRMENRYAREWVEHHLKMGVSRIYIYDNNRPGEEQIKDVLGQYIEQGMVEVTPWDKPQGQLPAYNDCYARHGWQHAWLGFIDFDEFVRLKGKRDLAKWLGQFTGKADVVALNWRTMTDSGLTRYDPRPLRRRFTQPMKADAHVKYDRPENDHLKAFVAGGIARLAWGITPHMPSAPRHLRVVNAKGEAVEQKPFAKYDHTTAWLDHFHTKTAEEFIDKCWRGFCCGGEEYDTRYRTRATEIFFRINERTPEKERMLSDIMLSIPNSTKIMEHVIKTHQGGKQYLLTAEPGWMLRSTKTGNTYQQIETCDLRRWQVVEVRKPATDKKAAPRKRTSKKK